MDHVAIMTKKYGYIHQILMGKKTIESRWYVQKRAPYGKINKGDTVYFKNSGGLVQARAEVNNVLTLNLNNIRDIEDIYQNYGKQIVPELTPKILPEYINSKIGKKYCILVFLINPTKIKPFQINKTGFGNACAWITIESIYSIKI